MRLGGGKAQCGDREDTMRGLDIEEPGSTQQGCRTLWCGVVIRSELECRETPLARQVVGRLPPREGGDQ
jgi:hypothetical protein